MQDKKNGTKTRTIIIVAYAWRINRKLKFIRERKREYPLIVLKQNRNETNWLN